MVLFKYRLPNGNVFIWLGTENRGESEGIDNVLVLAGGDVLFLKTMNILPLYKEQIMEDIMNLSHEEFTRSYGFPIDYNLWEDLREGVKTKKYPPFRQKVKGRINDFRNMASAYISEILRLEDPNEKTRQLESIIGECYIKIQEIKAELSR